jgi:glycine betaine/choline ABC-type transport system substrate-binding protein
VGSKNFTEQVILGELIAQVLERDTDLRVIRRLNLGGTFICDQALRAGEIDVYVEYSGTALTAIFRQPVAHDRRAVMTTTRDLYARAGITALDPLGFNNTFAILVRREDAEALPLKTIGDLHKTADRWRAGFGYEFLQRDDGYRGLAAAYGLRFREEPRVMDLTLMYRALDSRQVDVIAGDATSGLIDAFNLAVLEDERAYFPPYDAVPLVRSAVLLKHPKVRGALERLAGRIGEAEMRGLNRAVDYDHREVATVVREFLSR